MKSRQVEVASRKAEEASHQTEVLRHMVMTQLVQVVKLQTASCRVVNWQTEGTNVVSHHWR